MKGKRKAGGGPVRAGGNPNVFEEAERKRGGRTKRAAGGKVAGVAAPEPATKSVGLMTGGGVKPRLDRPGRKMGGRVGANTSPLSTAHGTTSPSPTPKAQVGPAS